MDPNETLKRIRGMMVQLMAGRLSAEDQNELAELIISLDGWLSKGGFLPEAWTRVTREQVDKLISKHEVRKVKGTMMREPHTRIDTANTGKQDLIRCTAKHDVFTCILPEGHEGPHSAGTLADGKTICTWTNYDECPICNRQDGTHDNLIHGRDHEE